MNLLTYLRSLDTTPTPADLVAAYNALSSNYVPVPAHRVIAWMGEAGRLSKIDAFLVASESAQDAPTLGLRAAVKAVLLGVANPNTVVETAPASPHRTLLAALVYATVLSDADALALIERGYAPGFAPITDQDAAAAIAQRDAEDAATARRAAYDARRNEVGLQVYGVADAELSRAMEAGEPLPSVDDLLAFVVAGRGN